MTDSHIVSYMCPRCRSVSYNPNDARERYCGRCHRFEDEPPLSVESGDSATDDPNAFEAPYWPGRPPPWRQQQ